MARGRAWVLGPIVWLSWAGCGQREVPPQQDQPPRATVETGGKLEATPPAAQDTPLPASEAATRPTPRAPVPPPPPRAQEPAPPPSQPTTSNPPAPPATPEGTPPGDVVDPGGVVAVEATKAGLTRLGPEKCKVCHKVQFESWAASAHAKRTPPLDCESCHGPGSEYKVLSVMKDPPRARVAGLVVPGREFCATCHRSGWSDAMLARAHAHKPNAGKP